MDSFYNNSYNKFVNCTPCKVKEGQINSNTTMKTACTYAATENQILHTPLNFVGTVPQFKLNDVEGRLSTPPDSIKKNQFEDIYQQNLFLNSPIKDSEKKAQYLRDTISKDRDEDPYSSSTNQDIKKNLFKKDKAQVCLSSILKTYFDSYSKISQSNQSNFQEFVFQNFMSNPELCVTLVELILSTLLNGYNNKSESEFFCFLVRFLLICSSLMLK